MRTFEEINATIAEITGVPVTNPAVDTVYDDYLQQFPSVEAIDALVGLGELTIRLKFHPSTRVEIGEKIRLAIPVDRCRALAE